MRFCTVQHGLDASANNGGKTVVVFPGTYREAIGSSQATNYVAVAVGIGDPVIEPTAVGPAALVERRHGWLEGVARV